MPTLHWLTRDKDVHAASRTPYRLLEEVRSHSVGDPDTGNMLIQGDNLDSLKALLPFCSGHVKCIYIDPLTTPAPRSNTTTTTWNTPAGLP